MSDLQKYIEKRKQSDKAFEKDFDNGYEIFKIAALLKQAREISGLSQEEIAKMIHEKKSTISKIENHAEDVRLSMLEKFASALGKKIKVFIK